LPPVSELASDPVGRVALRPDAPRRARRATLSKSIPLQPGESREGRQGSEVKPAAQLQPQITLMTQILRGLIKKIAFTFRVNLNRLCKPE